MEILRAIIPILMGLSLMLVPIGVILGILFGLKSRVEVDALKKKKMRTVAIVCFAVPVSSAFVLVTVWGLLGVL